MGKRKITGLALLIIGFSLFLIKLGLSAFLVKPLFQLTGFSVLQAIDSIKSSYLYFTGFAFIFIGILLIVFEKQEEKEIIKLEAK
tara:strand:- start:32 stop:286 length:255 start_codon:yes stop_codon:yes gene_type:complete